MLVAGIKSRETGRTLYLETLEVCLLGTIRRDIRKEIAKLVAVKLEERVRKQLAKLAISTSHQLFNCRKSKNWYEPTLFKMKC